MADQIFSNLLQTPYTALFMGVCLTVGAFTSVLSMGYYSIFRYPALFYFSISIVLSYLLFGLASQNPNRILDVENLPKHFYLQQTLVLFGIFFYYKMIRAAFQPENRLPFPRHTLEVLGLTLIAAKALAMMMPHIVLFRVASVCGVVFLAYAILSAVTYPARTTAMRLIQFGCALPTCIVLIYPLTRLGILRSELLIEHIPSLVMGAVTLHSTLWFLGLVEIARDARDKAKADSRQNMARTMMQLRDLIESPIEDIKDSVTALGDNANPPMTSILKDMDHSVNRLSLIKAVLSRFEKNMPPIRSDDEDTAS